jgi:hypothetical protein
MKKIIEAVISYAGITIAAASVGVIGGLVVVSQEVEPAWYKAVAGVWPKLDGTVQQEVASAMSGGYISRWGIHGPQRADFGTRHGLPGVRSG